MNCSHREIQYTLIVQGHLDLHWRSTFPNLEVLQLPGGLTRLRGPIADQSALHGILHTIRDSGLILLLVAAEHMNWDPFRCILEG